MVYKGKNKNNKWSKYLFGPTKKVVKGQKRAAEEIQDEYQATKVSKTIVGKKLRRVNVTRTQPEIKYQIIAQDAPGVLSNAALTYVLLNGMTQGVGGQGARIGDAITMTSVLGRVALSYLGGADAPTTSNRAIVRLMLVYDKQANGVQPINPLISSTGTGAVLSPLNPDNKRRLRIIWDKIVPMNVNGHDTEVISHYINFKNGMPVQYNNTNGGTVADINTGSLYFIYGAYGFGATAVYPSMSYQFKTNYSDS